MKVFSIFWFYLFLVSNLVWQGPGLGVPVSASDSSRLILFMGDSITAGLGVEPEQAYPVLISGMLKEKGVQGIKITNNSISGSTTASGFSRLRWSLLAGKDIPDILVLALGANDGLRGLSISEMSRNLDKTIALATEKGIQVILAGMEIPPNYGPEYSKAFREVFVSLADKHKIPLIPFLLKDVAGKAFLNQADGIHPNEEGHKIISYTILPYILEQL
jgi:acyl-CoA thioesterase-1